MIPEERAAGQTLSERGFDDGYLGWKGWGLADFAVLTERDRAYFSLEVAALPQLRVARALDVGFGLGAFLRFGHERGWRMSGTEAIPALVEAAQAAGFDAYPAESLAALPAGSFDLITAFDVLEHIPLAELPDFLRTLGGLLSPGGILLCRFPNGDSPFGRPFQNGDPTHCTVIGEARMNHCARLAGLCVVRFAGEARPLTDRSWRMRVSRLIVRSLEATLEPCIKRVMFPGWRFALFSPNSVCALQPTRPARDGSSTCRG
jgi:SAM-dependent methyltransferase